MEEQLQKISNLLSHKLSKTFHISDRKTDLKCIFNPPIKLDSNYNYEIGLIYFSANNAIYNITDKNNEVKINNKKFKLTPGAYEYKRISKEIENLSAASLDSSNRPNSKIKLEPDLATGRSKLTITEGSIKFNGLEKLLGFNNREFNKGTHISENRIMIRTIHTINIDCNIANGNSYKNGEESNIIFSFPAGIQPHGHDWHIEPSTRIYFPVTRTEIDEIRIRLIDENGNLINLDNENVSIYLHLKQV